MAERPATNWLVCGSRADRPRCIKKGFRGERRLGFHRNSPRVRDAKAFKGTLVVKHLQAAVEQLPDRAAPRGARRHLLGACISSWCGRVFARETVSEVWYGFGRYVFVCCDVVGCRSWCAAHRSPSIWTVGLWGLCLVGRNSSKSMPCTQKRGHARKKVACWEGHRAGLY